MIRFFIGYIFIFYLTWLNMNIVEMTTDYWPIVTTIITIIVAIIRQWITVDTLKSEHLQLKIDIKANHESALTEIDKVKKEAMDKIIDVETTTEALIHRLFDKMENVNTEISKITASLPMITKFMEELKTDIKEQQKDIKDLYKRKG